VGAIVYSVGVLAATENKKNLSLSLDLFWSIAVGSLWLPQRTGMSAETAIAFENARKQLETETNNRVKNSVLIHLCSLMKGVTR
jgi:hypothetical protein